MKKKPKSNRWKAERFAGNIVQTIIDASRKIQESARGGKPQFVMIPCPSENQYQEIDNEILAEMRNRT